jgi:hypothetical protein
LHVARRPVDLTTDAHRYLADAGHEHAALRFLGEDPAPLLPAAASVTL